MEEFDFMSTDNIAQDLMDIKETARIKKIISQLQMYDNDQKELTRIYTDILEEDNVSFVNKILIITNMVFLNIYYIQLKRLEKQVKYHLEMNN